MRANIVITGLLMFFGVGTQKMGEMI